MSNQPPTYHNSYPEPQPSQQQQQQYNSPYNTSPYEQQPVYMPQPMQYQQAAPVYVTPAPPEPGSGSAIAGFIIGIFALILWWIPVLGSLVPVTSLIFSLVGRRAHSKAGFSITGIILSIFALALSIFMLWLYITVIWAVSDSRY